MEVMEPGLYAAAFVIIAIVVLLILTGNGRRPPR